MRQWQVFLKHRLEGRSGTGSQNGLPSAMGDTS